MKFTRLLAVTIAFLLSTACAPVSEDKTGSASVEGESSLRLYVLECGVMDMADWDEFKHYYGVAKSRVAIAKQVNPCFLVSNRGETILWDLGLPDATPSEPFLDSHGIKVSMPRKLSDQLATLGLQASDIDYVALSHLHFDHVGNLADFGNSEVLLRKAELDGVRDDKGKLRVGYQQSLIDLVEHAPGLRSIEGDYDVFGDGSVTLIHAPGHTAGSQIALVRLPNYGSVIISGDTIHFQEELEHGILPRMNASQTEAAATIQRIRDLAAKESAELWIQHDPVQDKSRKRLPAYYD